MTSFQQGELIAMMTVLICVIYYHRKKLQQPQRSWRYKPPPQNDFFFWDLDTKDDSWFQYHMRFTKEEVRILLLHLNWESIEWRNRYQCTPELALCIVLYKLSWPNRLFTMAYEFSRSQAYISTIHNDTILFLTERYQKILLWHPSVDKKRAELFARKLKKYGECNTVWAFIDGTFRGFCRPSYAQRFDYSGYKGHGLKFQGVVGPDGLLFSLDGPCLGPTNDLTMFRESIAARKIAEFWPNGAADDMLYYYGDQAYCMEPGVLSPIPGDYHALTEDERTINNRMSSIRISIEQAFGSTQQLWTANAFQTGQKSGLQPVAAYYMVSVLLTNCYTCIRGNCVNARFLVKPPSITKYLIPPEDQ